MNPDTHRSWSSWSILWEVFIIAWNGALVFRRVVSRSWCIAQRRIISVILIIISGFWTIFSSYCLVGPIVQTGSWWSRRFRATAGTSISSMISGLILFAIIIISIGVIMRSRSRWRWSIIIIMWFWPIARAWPWSSWRRRRGVIPGFGSFLSPSSFSSTVVIISRSWAFFTRSWRSRSSTGRNWRRWRRFRFCLPCCWSRLEVCLLGWSVVLWS